MRNSETFYRRVILFDYINKIFGTASCCAVIADICYRIYLAGGRIYFDIAIPLCISLWVLGFYWPRMDRRFQKFRFTALRCIILCRKLERMESRRSFD